MTPEKLISMAVEAMGNAYAPYSGYKVGAALLCADGTVNIPAALRPYMGGKEKLVPKGR